ncbi:hypothetical protein GCM10007854_08310 [Algimonas porphyrae]|uniref:Uncharacterized protein n=1 Tax=Algimonas porphyrae TaxID=1128113 RepID=A0ABQ5UXE0_9PROT|nr:hypothetical protein GCM10007854_08310 [Algimonas porphyrae]
MILCRDKRELMPIFQLGPRLSLRIGNRDWIASQSALAVASVMGDRCHRAGHRSKPRCGIAL